MNSLQRFIYDNIDNNWKTQLENAPYHITITEDEHFYMFKYNQIKSDFSLQVVRDARGIILDKNKFKIACNPFPRFFNYGESNAAEIDWSNARIESKEDGSLLKLWWNKYKQDWQISTNGMLNAFDALLSAPLHGKWEVDNFGALFHYICTIKKHKIAWIQLPKEATHLVEICSLNNKVVLTYEDPTIFYICSRHNETGKEFIESDEIIPFPHVKRIKVKSIDDCYEALNKLDKNSEGFVIRDSHQNRVKLKTELYLLRHRMKGEGVFTEKRALQIIQIHEDEEFAAYFPEYEKMLLDIKVKLQMGILAILMEHKNLHQKHFKNRKEMALWIKGNCRYPHVLFYLVDNPDTDINEYIYGDLKRMGSLVGIKV